MIEQLRLVMDLAAKRGTFINGHPDWTWPGVLTEDAHLRKLVEEDILKAVQRALNRGIPKIVIELYGKGLGTFTETNKNIVAALETLDNLLDLFFIVRKK